MKEQLKNYDSKKVDLFIGYLSELKKPNLDKNGKDKHWWYSKVEEVEFVSAFKKVANEGLFIDGDTVTLNYLKGLVITYDYHAYQNKVKNVYPETMFDFGVVYKGDEFSFKKESGKVVYNHELKDPFSTDKEIIGAYGIIKNKKGEFLETINNEDIEKMKKTSRMSYIWDKWLDRMVLKSVIKRICKIHFKDEVKNLENEDNEQYDLELLEIDLEMEAIYATIEKAKTIDDLSKIYQENNLKVSDKKVFLKKLGEKKEEINSNIQEKRDIIENCKIKNTDKFIKYLSDQKMNYIEMSKDEIIDKCENYNILELNN